MVITVRKLLKELDGRGLACDMPEQVMPDLERIFGINRDTPLRVVIAKEVDNG